MTVHARLTKPTPVQLTAANFHMLDAAGAFDRYARTELVEGVIVAMTVQYSLHARVKTQLAVELELALRMLGSDLEAICEPSVSADDFNEPMPDILVGVPSMERVPLPLANVRLAVAVADTTLVFDLNKKGTVSARVGIPEYWVVDLKGQKILRMTGPSARGYALRDEVTLGDPVSSLTIDGLRVETQRLTRA
jgi:Uma2 family endonuclease